MAEENPSGNRPSQGGENDASEPMGALKTGRHMIPVWFFVGLLLLIFGVLITISGIAEYSHPPNTVLSNLHAPIWWGALLIVMGAVYVHRFWPRKERD